MANSPAGTTAIVLAGGGSYGAIQVGMLRELVAHGVKPDLVVGSSVGAISGAYFAGTDCPHMTHCAFKAAERVVDR